MLKTTAMLLEELSRYASPRCRLSRMAKQGIVTRIVKGLYETDRSVSPHLLAGSIYGPSYVSFEFALSYYGLIPEAVCAVTSATFAKRKSKTYKTPFGVFYYRDVPSQVFPLALKLVREGDWYFRIASPEKAMCDKLYTLSPAKTIAEMDYLLTEFLRIDDDDICSLDISCLEYLAQRYHSTTIDKLCSCLRRRQR